MSGAAEPAGRGSPVVRWAERASTAALVGVGGTLAAAYVILGSLAAASWQNASFALQVLHLAAVGVGFAALLWGFWGAIGAAAAACVTALGVTIAGGRLSLHEHKEFFRMPFLLECALFAVLAWITLRFLEREQTEETADRRQLERLEEEFLDLAIQYGKKEDLLKVLQRKSDRLRQIEVLAGRIQPGADPVSSIQICLDQVAASIGKGEAEILLLSGEGGAVRHARGGAPVELREGRDEIDRWVEEHRTSLLVNNLTHDVRFTPAFGRARQIASAVAVPMTWEGRLRGTLRLSSVTPQAFSHEDLRFVTEAVNLLSPALFRTG